MSQYTLSQIFTYPVKSLKGVTSNCLQLGEKGPDDDRRYMLIDENGHFLTQRQNPKMTLIKATLEGGDLLLSVDGTNELFVDESDRNENLTEVVVWQDSVQAQDCGTRAADWLSDCLGKSVRLVYMPDSTQRLVDQNYAHHGELVSFADGFPLLLISEASLEDLNSRLAQSVSINRFRPNLVVRGCDPHEEDRWKKIRIGQEVFDIVKPCARCVVPSINPETAEKTPQLLKELSTYRRGEDGKVYFGQNLIHRTFGRLQLGDAVEIIEC